MGEVFEKGLMIGFGLIVLTLIINLINPIINYLLVSKYEENYKDLENLVVVFDYGLNYYQGSNEETISFQFKLRREIILECNRTRELTEIFLYSGGEFLSILTLKSVYINTSQLYGNFTMNFTYLEEYIQINFIWD